MMKFSQLTRLATPIKFFAILGIGVVTAVLFISTSPTSKRIPPPVSSPFVRVTPTVHESALLTIRALGTVKAAQETTVRMRVTGQVEALGKEVEAGGHLKKGDFIVEIDAKDYKNALALKESVLAKAKADYELEMGLQRVARTEVEQLNKTSPHAIKNTALALRKPQLAQAKAALASAQADVRQAKLNLERTRIIAPYNALVTSRDVSLGSQATPSDSIANIVGTDEFYVEAGIPLDKLHSLGINTFEDIPVTIASSTGTKRKGYVRHSIATLDSTTRMGRLLVVVEDPLGLQSQESALLLGDQVWVELGVGMLEKVVTLPRSSLRGNDTVWVAVPTSDGGHSLDIRHVTVAWKDTTRVHIDKGLAAGELVITSPLGASIPGMPLRLVNTEKVGASAEQPLASAEGSNE